MASDGQVTFGQTRREAGRAQDPPALHDQILAGFAGSAADGFALFARFEAKLEEYRGNLERSAVELAQRLAHRPRAAPARGDAGRRGPTSTYLPALGHRRPHRARRRHRRDRIGRPVCAGRGAGARAAHRARRARDRRAGDGDRRRDLHLHERPARRSKNCKTMPIYLPETHATSRPRRSRRARSSPSSTSTSSARTRRSAPSRSRCATASAGSSCRRRWPRKSRRRTS